MRPASLPLPSGSQALLRPEEPPRPVARKLRGYTRMSGVVTCAGAAREAGAGGIVARRFLPAKAATSDAGASRRASAGPS